MNNQGKLVLTRVRLVNWYSYWDEIIPIGDTTLVTGKNGSGKSCFLDAVMYGLIGNTDFSNSTDSKKSKRYLNDYTRGLIDNTKGKYMRSYADKAHDFKSVYTHIILEMQDLKDNKSFILGTVIKTTGPDRDSSKETKRYIADNKIIEDVEIVHAGPDGEIVCSAEEISKKYGFPMFQSNEGIRRFMKRCGIDPDQYDEYKRKMKRASNYDPKDSVEKFIRENSLPKNEVKFKRLKDLKKERDAIEDTIQNLENENNELDNIISHFSEFDNLQIRLDRDNIRIAYKNLSDIQNEIDTNDNRAKINEAEAESENKACIDIRKELKTCQDQKLAVSTSLNRFDVQKDIEDLDRHIKNYESDLKTAEEECQKLDLLEECVKTVINEEDIESNSVLNNLASEKYSNAEKKISVENLRDKIAEIQNNIQLNMYDIKAENNEFQSDADRQRYIINNSSNAKASLDVLSPEQYKAKNLINDTFKKNGINSEAHLACEYVLGITDERWQRAIEACLGPMRFTILTDPEYYDKASEILSNSSCRYAHLFNTKLLMKKNVRVEDDAVSKLLNVPNPIARKYFDFRLGMMRAAEQKDVGDYEYALSKEGRISRAMDTWYLNLNKIQFFALGTEAMRINAENAKLILEKDENIIKKNREKEKTLEDRYKHLQAHTLILEKEYNYNANKEKKDISSKIDGMNNDRQDLINAAKNDTEIFELSQKLELLKKEEEELNKQYTTHTQNVGAYKQYAKDCREKIEEYREKEENAKEILGMYYRDKTELTVNTIREYRKFISHESGIGGILNKRSRSDLESDIKKTELNINNLQIDYNNHFPGNYPTGANCREEYEKRKRQIQFSDMEHYKQAMKDKTMSVEETFKNEIVAKIYERCEAGINELKRANNILKSLDVLNTKYAYTYKYIDDGSDYDKIIKYAKYLNASNEEEQAGQISFDETTLFSENEKENIIKDMDEVIDHVMQMSDEEISATLADYRNYLSLDIKFTRGEIEDGLLSKQYDHDSGAEVQIPYTLILISSLLMIYDAPGRTDSSIRLVFMDEPFANVDDVNINAMVDYFKELNLQVIFFSSNKLGSIGPKCDVKLGALNKRQKRTMKMISIEKSEFRKGGDVRVA